MLIAAYFLINVVIMIRMTYLLMEDKTPSEFRHEMDRDEEFWRIPFWMIICLLFGVFFGIISLVQRIRNR
jgi:Ca2+/Na+ antiporter